MSNLDFLQSENDRREAEAQASAQEAFADSTQPGETIQPWRYGVAKIVANSGSGAYTITEQYLDSLGVWQACSVLGFVAATAYDFQLRTTGTAGDTVVFWQTSKGGGTSAYLIDVGAGAGDASDYASLSWAGWIDTTDPGAGSTLELVLDSNDWRGRVVTEQSDVYCGTAAAAAGNVVWQESSTGGAAGSGDRDAGAVVGAGYTGELILFHAVEAAGTGTTYLEVFIDGGNSGKLTARVGRTGAWVQMQGYVVATATAQRTTNDVTIT